MSDDATITTRPTGQDRDAPPVWDAIVIGGGAAGLSAALVLGRARRRTLVLDAGHPSNAPAHGIGGLLGHDGRPPSELYAMGRDELAGYPSVEVRTATVVAARSLPGDRPTDRFGTFTVALDDGSTETARRVVLATGMDYRRPDLPGADERWGRSVFHCPFCHGWEVRDQALGVLDPGPAGVHRSLMLTFWSDDVTLLTDGPAELGDEDATRLAAAGVVVDERPVAELVGDGDALRAVVFTDGSERPLGGLLIPVTLHQRSGLAAMFGVEAAPPGMIAADAVAIDAMAATNVPGVFAGGDLGAAMPSVANAIAGGASAAFAVVHSLLVEAHDLPG